MKFGKLIEITTDELEEMFLSIDCPEKMKIALIYFTSFTKLVKFGGAGYYDVFTMAEIKFNESEVEKVYYLSLLRENNDLFKLITEHMQSDETPLDVMLRIFEVIDLQKENINEENYR